MDILRCIHHIFRNYKKQGKRLFFFCPVGQPKNVFFSGILYSNICGIKFYSTSVTEYIPYCPILNECFYILLQSITLITRHKLQCVFFLNFTVYHNTKIEWYVNVYACACPYWHSIRIPSVNLHQFFNGCILNLLLLISGLNICSVLNIH